MMNYDERQVIFCEGHEDPYLYKIMSGKVGLYLDYGTVNEKLVGITTAPNYIGAMNVFKIQPAVYTAVTMTKTMLLKLPETDLVTFVKSDSGMALNLIKTLVDQLTMQRQELNAMVSELRDLSTPLKPERRALQELVTRYEAVVHSVPIVDEYEAYVPAPDPMHEVDVNLRDAIQSAAEWYLPGHRGYPDITHPEYRDYLITVDYTCPHCRTKFKGDKILTSQLIPVRSNAEELRYDLRVSYRGFETEWYEIVTCPHCFFSSFENHFQESKSIYKSRFETKLAQFCDNVALDFTQERDLDFVFAQHYLALICAPGFTDWRQITARVWMNLIRLYQDTGDTELAKIAEQRAVEAYRTVYMECELQPGQEQRLCLTVAGMLYARGEKKEARVWATRVRMGSGDRSAYWNMAEQLIQDVRAELEAEKE